MPILRDPEPHIHQSVRPVCSLTHSAQVLPVHHLFYMSHKKPDL